MTFTPTRRYTAVTVFSEDLERVVLIHKLRPTWQAGKANFPGGKVDLMDWPVVPEEAGHDTAEGIAYRRCAARELAEETGLVVNPERLVLFCTLRFKSREGDDAECQFFTCMGDVEAARTMEAERVFVASVNIVLTRSFAYDATQISVGIPTMSNLPWLTAMARQALQDSSALPFVVYETGATP